MLRALLVGLLLAAPLPVPAVVGALTGDGSGPQGPEGVLLHALAAAGMGVPAPDLGALPVGSLRDELLRSYALQGLEPNARGLRDLDAGLAAVPHEVQAPVARVLAAMNAAEAMRADAFARVAPQDLAWARGASLNLDKLTPAQVERLERVKDAIDVPEMMRAGALVLAAVQASVPELKAAAALPGLYGLDFVDPLGNVEVSGTQDDVHTRDRTLLVDLGGDDVWSNNAGADFPNEIIDAVPGCATQGALECTPLSQTRNGQAIKDVLGRRCAVDGLDPVFDVNDYTGQVSAAGTDPAALLAAAGQAPAAAQRAAGDLAPDTGCLPQGPDDAQPWLDDFIYKGTPTDGDQHNVAVGIDVSGDDTYAPPRVFNFMNDGTSPAHCDSRGMGDAGKLWARNLTAGSAFAGVGILWDASGSDFYGGRSLTQGSAHLGAVAALVDQGPGSDHYVGVRFAQGSGLVGAAGLLYDDGGGNTFELKNDVAFFNEFEAFVGCDISTRDGQGRDNFDAVGALVVGGPGNAFSVEDHIPLCAAGVIKDCSGASRDDPTTTQGSTGFRLNVGPSIDNALEAAGRGVLWVQQGGSDSFTRAGRGNRCLDASGTFWDEDAASPASSLGPCPVG